MNLDVEINEAIEKAIEKHSRPGDVVDYRSGLTVVAGEGGQPQVIAVIVLRMNAAVTGEYITSAFFTDTPVPNAEQLDGPMGDALSNLRMARIEQMRNLVDQASGNGDHGHGPSLPPMRRLELPGV